MPLVAHSPLPTFETLRAQGETILSLDRAAHQDIRELHSVPGLGRSDETRTYVERYYTTFEKLREDGLDALIITGANVASPTLEAEPFWAPLQEVFDWATERVPSVRCSCLATHALLKHYHGVDRRRLPRKRWGVYRHRVTDRSHPLLRNVNTRFDVPHSRHNEISAEQFRGAGLTV